VNSQYDTTIIAGDGRRYSDGGKDLDKSLSMGALLRCAAIWLALAFAFAAALVPVTARAQQKITFANARTVTVNVTVGKSQDIHTDQSLVDIMVGDPDIADVNPLTDHALSISARRSAPPGSRSTARTRRSSAFSTWKCPTTCRGCRLSSRISPAAASRCLRSTAASCSAAPRRTPSPGQGGQHRQAVRAGHHQYRSGDAAAADHAGSALHRSVAASRP